MYLATCTITWYEQRKDKRLEKFWQDRTPWQSLQWRSRDLGSSILNVSYLDMKYNTLKWNIHCKPTVEQFALKNIRKQLTAGRIILIKYNTMATHRWWSSVTTMPPCEKSIVNGWRGSCIFERFGASLYKRSGISGQSQAHGGQERSMTHV